MRARIKILKDLEKFSIGGDAWFKAGEIEIANILPDHAVIHHGCGQTWRFYDDEYEILDQVQAEIIFLSPEQGGRLTPTIANYYYRPQFYIDGHDYDAMHTYPDLKRGDQIQPGKKHCVLLEFMSPQLIWPKLEVGKAFQIREGAKVVATGTIQNIYEVFADD